MTDYVKSISFAALAGLDALPTTFDTEFALVATSSATKADKLNPTFSGTVVIPALAAATSHAGNALKTSPVQSGELYMHVFATGTKAPFFQATAPTGWTQDITNNDALLRVVSGGSGGSAGGTNGFVATPLNVTGSHTLTISQIPAHSHTYSQRQPSTSTGNFATGSAYSGGVSTKNTGSSGGNGGHTHSITFTPKYIDLIVCTKD